MDTLCHEHALRYMNRVSLPKELKGNKIDIEYIIFGTGEDKTNFTTTFGMGIIPMISNRVGIDIGVSADIIFVGGGYSYYYGYQNQYAFIIDLKVGVVGLF